MNKSGSFGMRFHQAFSFSHMLMRMSCKTAVFWPGCALMNLDPAILNKTYEVLKRAEPDLGISTCCCGQPTCYLFLEKHTGRKQKLSKLLSSRGVQRVYTACPNCAVQLRELGGVEVIPIWETLAAHLEKSDLVSSVAGESLVLHDPCPMRKESAQLAAVRRLCEMAGIRIEEPEHSGERTLCCGNFHMMRALDPEKSAKMRAARLAEFPQGMTVASCCEGCLDAFRSEGRSDAHILELLFGKSEKRGWGNRFAFTRMHKK
ncbi:MAG: (Fe-S)-binding protein [Clostridia bacterium]|nr:(Fe-S)-binding protein [Clostridia bacterium]